MYQNSFITAAQAQTRQWLRLSCRRDTVDPESTAVIGIGGLADKCLIYGDEHTRAPLMNIPGELSLPADVTRLGVPAGLNIDPISTVIETPVMGWSYLVSPSSLTFGRVPAKRRVNSPLFLCSTPDKSAVYLKAALKHKTVLTCYLFSVISGR